MLHSILWLGCAGITPLQPPPNFLIVLMDDVGRDKIRLYHSNGLTAPTPNLDALAARGVTFDRAWACHACSPTRATLLTGRYSDRHGIGAVIDGTDGVHTPLDPNEVVIPEALPRHSSIALGKWHLRDGPVPRDHQIQVGFDSFIGTLGGSDYFTWRRLSPGVFQTEHGYYPVSLAQDTITALQRMPEPFFVYYAPRLAHSPYHDPPDELHTQGNPSGSGPLHKAMVESFDTLLGRVLAHVDLDETFVFVIGDNGSPGATVADPHDPLRSKGTLYEGGIGVPFVVAGPGVLQGVRSDALVHVVDVFATVLELAGEPAASGHAEDSVSFASALFDAGSLGERSSMYATRFPHPGINGQRRRAVRTSRYKLIVNTTTGVRELFDLESDPFERSNLIQTAPGQGTNALALRLEALIPTFP